MIAPRSTRPIVFDAVRHSDSPLVERVWCSHSERRGGFTSVAMSNWEIVFTRLNGRTLVTLRGPETKPTPAGCPTDGEWLGIRFRAGTFMPGLFIGELADRRDLTLPQTSERFFVLNGARFEIPAFHNAESLVAPDRAHARSHRTAGATAVASVQ